MSLPRLNLRRGIWPLLLLAVAGCGPAEQITSYTVQKVQQTPGKPQQILGAIVLVEDAGWFFKLTGDPAQVGPKRNDFLTFVKSVNFSGAGPQATWNLPEGWKELPGDDVRFATVQMPGDKEPLAIAVSVLPKYVEDEVYVLTNINRWRGQVGLSAIDQAELAKILETFKVAGHDCKFVSLVGEAQAGGMGRTPIAPIATGGGATPRASAPAETGPTREKPSAAGSRELTYDTPQGWTPGKSTGLSRASFVVTEGDAKVEITVTPLGRGSGTLLDNVNRWRRQVQLPDVTEAELATIVKKVETLGVTGHYVELVGPGSTLLGAVVTGDDQIWYIKLIGDSKLAERENARFQTFVKSLRLQ